MAVQSTVNQIDGALTYPSTKTIATKQHMAVWVFNPNIPSEPPSFGWQQVSILDYDLVNNAAVIRSETVLAGMTLLEVRVADNPNELEYSPSVIAIIASIAREIVITACSAYEIVVVADNIEAVKACSDSIQDINLCADHIDEIADAPVNARNAQLRAWDSEAESMTADSYATEPEDVLVKEYTSNDDGTFTPADVPDTYSSFHYMKKSEAMQGGLYYVGDWKASLGVYPTTRPPEGTGDPLELADTFIVIEEGVIDGRLYSAGDMMVYNAPSDWTRIEHTNDWSDLTNIPHNVTNAITDAELQVGLNTKPTGAWSFDGTTLAITIP